jgi:hypothetical protein
MTSVMKSVKLYSWVCLSVLHPSFPTQLTILEKWLTCGQRKEVVSAPGTITIDNASHGWFKTWSFNITTTLEE